MEKIILKTIGVLSGKGGTGKTTIACSIAVALARKHSQSGLCFEYKVALLDADLTGMNARDVLGDNPIDVDGDFLVPAMFENLKYISLGHIAAPNDAVLWEPRIHEEQGLDGKKSVKIVDDYRAVVRQLLERTEWGDLDFLIVDFPPGSGTVVQEMLPKMDAVVLVTVPSHLSRSNVRRCMEMCREKSVPILGLIKNMTVFECDCGRRTRIFPDDHSFEEFGIPVLAEIPLRPQVAKDKLIEDIPVEKIVNAKPILLKRTHLQRTLLKFTAKLAFRRISEATRKMGESENGVHQEPS
jgi:ATP-binding protein involved in chromosome partitioning